MRRGCGARHGWRAATKSGSDAEKDRTGGAQEQQRVSVALAPKALSPRQRARASSPQTQYRRREARGDVNSGESGDCFWRRKERRNNLHPPSAPGCLSRGHRRRPNATPAHTCDYYALISTPPAARLSSHHTATAVVVRMMKARPAWKKCYTKKKISNVYTGLHTRTFWELPNLLQCGRLLRMTFKSFFSSTGYASG